MPLRFLPLLAAAMLASINASNVQAQSSVIGSLVRTPAVVSIAIETPAAAPRYAAE